MADNQPEDVLDYEDEIILEDEHKDDSGSKPAEG